MYRNLEAELARKNIKRADLARALGIDIATVSEKLTKPRRLKLHEAETIKRIFFPEETIDYLFSTEPKTA